MRERAPPAESESAATSQHQRNEAVFPMLRGTAAFAPLNTLHSPLSKQIAGRGSGWERGARSRSKEKRGERQAGERRRTREEEAMAGREILEASKASGSVLIAGWLGWLFASLGGCLLLL